MTRSEKVFIAVALLFAALFVRLGFWQLSRLSERQAYNAPIEMRLGQKPVQLGSVPRDLEQARHRRVVLTGEYDYEHELVLALRSRQGSPGVNLLTPLRVAGTDTVVLVNRGWIYAADGVKGDPRPWREPDPRGAVGYIRPLDTGSRAGARITGHVNAVRRPHLPTIDSILPYPVAPYYVVLTSSGTDSNRTPPRVPPPALDEGSHRSYAVQWFTFALIALGGTAILVLRRRAGNTVTSG